MENVKTEVSIDVGKWWEMSKAMSVCEVPGFCKVSLEDIDLIQAFMSTGKAKITLSNGTVIERYKNGNLMLKCGFVNVFGDDIAVSVRERQYAIICRVDVKEFGFRINATLWMEASKK